MKCVNAGPFRRRPATIFFQDQRAARCQVIFRGHRRDRGRTAQGIAQLGPAPQQEIVCHGDRHQAAGHGFRGFRSRVTAWLAWSSGYPGFGLKAQRLEPLRCDRRLVITTRSSMSAVKWLQILINASLKMSASSFNRRPAFRCGGGLTLAS